MAVEQRLTEQVIQEPFEASITVKKIMPTCPTSPAQLGKMPTRTGRLAFL
jgi:hypothetical protein